MGQAKRRTLPEARRLLGTLLVAWTFITGLAATLASAYYMKTGDLAVLIAYLGAPFVVGMLLFLALAMTTLATRATGVGEHAITPPEGLRRRDIPGRK